jgi:hypothetical protein
MRSRWPKDDSGAYAILYGLIVVAIVMTTATVVDLSSMREDRRVERLATDAAATAGAVKLNALAGVADAQAACQEAWRFLRVNLPGASGAEPSCPPGTFPGRFTTCPSTAGSATAAAGPWKVTITWPVLDEDPLMTNPNVTGRGSYQQRPDAETDGSDPCGRLGVTVTRARDFLFAGVGGFVGASTGNSSVARAELRGQVVQEFPLVVLDQSKCAVLLASGSTTQDATIRVLNNGITPGRLAMDSAADSTDPNPPGCGNSNQYAAMINGGGKIVALDGTSGSPGVLLSHATDLTKAASASDVCPVGTDPSTVTRGICPRPQSYVMITRKYWDWQYHCTTATSEPLSAPCPYTAAVPDHITNIRSQFKKTVFDAESARTLGWTVVTSCNDSAAFSYYPGNVYVDCDTFNVNHTTVFGGGGASTVVFKGDVDISGNGPGSHCLVFNQPVGATAVPDASGVYSFCNPTSSVVTPAPSGPMLVYLQDGNLVRQNADFISAETTIYQEADPSFGGAWDNVIDLGAGTSSNLLMTGPTTTGYPFQNLTVWSENKAGVINSVSKANQLGSQNKLALEGTLFLPNGQTNFGGNPTYLGQAKAQFVAWRLSVAGGGTLELVPDPNRTLAIPVGGVRLIR